MLTEKELQIKSRERVTNHGEVFTAEREVNAMLDLVKNETQRIDSCFLEPACGNGNFLVKILERKLKVVTDKYAKHQSEWEFYSLQALSSIYGIDILEDNCKECRNRLLDIFTENYTSLYKKRTKPQCILTASYLLDKNIICGNALDLKTSDNTDIYFAQWSFTLPNKVKRIDYTMRDLIATEPNSLFPDAQEVKRFPSTHFLKIKEAYESSEL
ncbi:MAG: hypothetical protein IJ681_01615 [Bacteroidales bacterium]|nr:hypothetical protein [Bacteroidales bacterium]